MALATALPVHACVPSMGTQVPHVLDAFVQTAPVTGAAPGRRTEAMLWQDGRSLCVRVRAFDDQPAGIVARQMRRDAESILSEDQVTLVIDVEGAGRNAYLFAVNAQGAQFDALVFDGGQMREDWDARWHSDARIDAEGWSAELAIPLSVFGRTEPGRDAGSIHQWRINAERWMPRGSERVRLTGISPDRQVYSLGEGVALPAMRAPQEGWGLRIKPSLRATGESALASGTGEQRYRLEPGLELFHESQRGVRTTAAFNIDFGEAEVDQRQVNLTRFELFLPEKREFFLQDAGRFSFGGLVSSTVTPYYSRRIGLDETGRARSLDAGLKVTGQGAGFDYGVFGARVAGGPTEPGQPDQSSADVAVLRLARPLDARHRIGLIGTHGNPEGSSGSHLWGLDYQFRDTDWSPPGWSGAAGGKTLDAYLWWQQSTNAGLGRDGAWGARVEYPNLGLVGSAEVQRIEQHFLPALGYLAEAGVTRGQGDIGWWHRTADGTDFTPGVDWNFRRRIDGSEHSWLLNPEVGFTTPAGDTFMAEMFFESDELASPYAMLPGVDVAAGQYRWHYLFGYMETARSRPVWAHAELRHGGYYDGNRNDQILNLGWQPGPRWGWQFGLARNAIDLPGGSFTVRTASVRLDYTPTTLLASSLLLQWDNVSHEAGASARLRWRFTPDADLFFSLDRLGYTGDGRRYEPMQTRGMLKMVWNLER